MDGRQVPEHLAPLLRDRSHHHHRPLKENGAVGCPPRWDTNHRPAFFSLANDAGAFLSRANSDLALQFRPFDGIPLLPQLVMNYI